MIVRVRGKGMSRVDKIGKRDRIMLPNWKRLSTARPFSITDPASTSQAGQKAQKYCGLRSRKIATRSALPLR